MAISGTKINGHVFDWSSVEIDINGEIFTNVQEINYEATLEPGIRRGTSAVKTGRTRGEFNSEGSVTMYLGDFNHLVQALGDAYMEKSFDITVSYSEEDEEAITDTLVGCRIKKRGKQYSNGTDPLQVAVDLDIMSILDNGVSPVRVRDSA